MNFLHGGDRPLLFSRRFRRRQDDHDRDGNVKNKVVGYISRYFGKLRKKKTGRVGLGSSTSSDFTGLGTSPSDGDSDGLGSSPSDVDPDGDISGLRRSTSFDLAVDPEGDSSSLCTACRIPIFSTPSVTISHKGEHLLLHEQCDTMLPEHVDHELHPDHTLVLVNQLHLPTPITTPPCSGCKEECGTMFYQCPEDGCDFRLDLLCVVQIKIVHRSHHHHGMVVVRLRDSASLTCNACEEKHDSPPSESATVSYLCNICGYWIHFSCASLHNVVHFEKHEHSLYLTYDYRRFMGLRCVICSKVFTSTSGGYFCLLHPKYVVHIRCALTHPSFTPVFMRDVQVSDLARLPMPDEYTNLIPHIRSGSTDDRHENLHEHPLISRRRDEVEQSTIPRACNACVQLVSPPFLSCSDCPSFFLHSSCCHLPSRIEHRAHVHPLSPSSKALKSDASTSFYCKGCELRCNGLAYSCESCVEDYKMDVVCALLNPAITHGSHKKTHILIMATDIQSNEICSCCGAGLSGIRYECDSCRNFRLHARCALLPSTVSHPFDVHPLQLTTTAPKETTAATDADEEGDAEICEVCEGYIWKKHTIKQWHYYRCSECDQSFHIDCIPSVDRLSKMKLGSTVKIDGHGCPLVLVRMDDADCVGYRCGVCKEVLKSSEDGLAYECSKCFFGIHYACLHVSTN